MVATHCKFPKFIGRPRVTGTVTNSALFVVLLLSLAACGGGAQAPSNFSYSSPVEATVGVEIAPLTPTVSGTVTTYTVAPALPAGLNLDSATGIISGIPTTDATQATYLVRATNSGGTASFGLVITVRHAAPTGLSYPGPVIIGVGEPLPELKPAVTGNVSTYSVAPMLPRGVSLDPTTGTISGTPRESINATDFVITAANSGGSTTYPLSMRVTTSQGAPVPTTYQPFFINDPAYPYAGQPVSLYAWEGRHVAILSSKNDLNPGTMQLWLDAIDRGYEYYEQATGRVPQLFRHFNLKLAIADVPQTCGAGCGYLGFTGIEAGSTYFDRMYQWARDGYFGSFLFYELGRNFWFYGDEIAYKDPVLPWPVVTGYAVVNWWWSMEAADVRIPVAQSCNGTDHDGWFNHMAAVLDLYVANPQLNWGNTLGSNQGVAPNGCALDANVLFNAFLLRVRRDFSDAGFPMRIWREVDARPNATTTQQAVDNMVLAVSVAAGKNLTRIFEEDWRWPLSQAAKDEALMKLGPPL